MSALSRRYGHANPKSQHGIPHHYEAVDVLAGAYNRGLGPREDQECLVHTAVCAANGSTLHTLCKRIPLEHLIGDAASSLREPTCPICKQRLETARAKGKALVFIDNRAP